MTAMAASLTILAACGGSAPATFDLTAPTERIVAHARGQLAVAEPVTTSAIDSERIVIRTGPESLAYLTGAQWSDRVPRLVQTRLIQTFENGHVKAVGRAGDRLTADRVLTSEIRRFEIDVTTNEAVVEISAKILADSSGRVAAARIFTTRAPGSAGDGAAAAHALDSALGDALRQIVAWAR